MVCEINLHISVCLLIFHPPYTTPNQLEMSILQVDQPKPMPWNTQHNPSIFFSAKLLRRLAGWKTEDKGLTGCIRSNGLVLRDAVEPGKLKDMKPKRRYRTWKSSCAAPMINLGGGGLCHYHVENGMIIFISRLWKLPNQAVYIMSSWGCTSEN